MKRDVIVTSFGSSRSTATIINDRDGLRVEDRKPNHDNADFFIRGFLCNCIDMDEWNHSWHLNVTNAKNRGSEERKKIRSILDEKIELRLLEIEKLKDAKIVLSKWSYNF